MDATDARRALWERYDAGEMTADEVETRLRLLDAAGDDRAVAAALDRPIPLRRRRGTRRAAVAAGAVFVVAVAAGYVTGDGGGGGSRAAEGQFGVATTAVGVAGPAASAPPDCPQADTADDPTDPAANPALLSEPAFAPEGYEVDDDDDTIEPGADPDTTMSVAAGNPLPVEIRGRVLDGELAVRMRAFRYADDAASADAAVAAAESGCSFGGESFSVPDRPEIGGTIVRGPIPTTVFAGWRLGDRRFIVAVEPGTDEADELDAAKALAGAIAAAELEAARNPPPPPAP